MEENSQIEFLLKNVNDRLKSVFEHVERSKEETFREIFGIFHPFHVETERHKDSQTSECCDGTKLHAIYLHKNHVLFLDWFLNHTRSYTNMPYSLELAKQLKEATSAILKKIENEENQNIKTESHKDVKTEECQDSVKSKLEALDYCIEKLMEEVGQIKEYLYDKFENRSPKQGTHVFHCHRCGKNCLKIDNGFMTWGCYAA